MNKLQQLIYERYLRSDMYTLRDCYKSWSYEKDEVFKRLCHECVNTYKSKTFKIVSFNSNMFTCAWTYTRNGIKYLHYVTKYAAHDWRIE